MPEAQIKIEDAGGWIIAKDHVDKAAFMAEASLQYGVDESLEPEVQHTYLRVVPAPKGSEWDYLYYKAKGPGRGAFAATLLELE